MISKDVVFGMILMGIGGDFCCMIGLMGGCLCGVVV